MPISPPSCQGLVEEAVERQYANPLPPILIHFTPHEDAKEEGTYQCPVYSTTSRSHQDGRSSYCFALPLAIAPGTAGALATAGAAILTQYSQEE